MSLTPGTRLGAYEIVSAIGAGGMGEVFRANDTRLGRVVAIKVLPLAFASDPERLARFEREAKLLAALNHPNVASIYGFEHTGDRHFLVMEFADGEDLSLRLERGPIGVTEAIGLALQLVEALEEAHEKGIVHRDLKPANVVLTSNERIKVLDFGLAKALEGDAWRDVSDLSRSPTVTEAMTGANVILGTAAYMSPEQARGRRVDKRADVWAFGCVVYEMLTGRRPFDGETVSDTLASVLKIQPDWSALPADVPRNLRALLLRCLEKDPKQRLRDIGEARVTLQKIQGGEPEDSAPAPAAPSILTRRNSRIALIGVLAALVAAGFVGWSLKPTPTLEAAWTDLLPPDDQAFATGFGGHFALSPDGHRLAFVASDSTETYRLWIRDFASVSSRVVSGTDDATYPFWSPDGSSVGFFAGGKLKRVDADGGAPLTLADAPNGRGGAWSASGMVLFAPNADGGLSVVGADGGDVRTVLAPDSSNVSFRWPHFLADGTNFLFCDASDSVAIHVGSLSGTQSRPLPLGSGFAGNVAFADRFLFYVQEDALRARPFDPRRVEFTGDAVTVASPLMWNRPRVKAPVSVAAGGTIAFLPSPQSSGAAVAEYDRAGRRIGVVRVPVLIEDIDLSSDGRRFALTLQDEQGSKLDVWVYDYSRQLFSRLTFSGEDDDPVWSPDGTRIAWAHGGNLYVKNASGAGAEESLFESNDDKVLNQWLPDGRGILYVLAGPGPEQIWLYELGASEPRLIRGSPKFWQNQAQLSNDGHWLAYTSNESGTAQVYVQDFPEMLGRWQISAQGGGSARWRADGKEIYYMDPNSRIIAVPIESRDSELIVGGGTVLVETASDGVGWRRPQFGVNADGTRFVVMEREQTSGEKEALTLVQHWRPGNLTTR